MLKVIAKMEKETGKVLVEMTEQEFDDLLKCTGIEWEKRRNGVKIGMCVDAEKIMDLYKAFQVLGDVKSDIKGLLTKWQTVVSKIELTEKEKEKK